MINLNLKGNIEKLKFFIYYIKVIKDDYCIFFFFYN